MTLTKQDVRIVALEKAIKHMTGKVAKSNEVVEVAKAFEEYILGKARNED